MASTSILHEHPPRVTRLDTRVIAARVARHVLELSERLDAGKARADEHKGQRSAAQIRILRGGGDIKPSKYMIAQVNRLTDGLETDSVISWTVDLKCPRDGTKRKRCDEDVVTHPPRFSRCGLKVHIVTGVRDCCHAAVKHSGIAKDLPQRSDHVPLGQVAGRGPGEEGLVGHVRLRVDDTYFRLHGQGKATCLARRKTASSISWVTRPVNVFCWLGW